MGMERRLAPDDIRMSQPKEVITVLEKHPYARLEAFDCRKRDFIVVVDCDHFAVPTVFC